MHLGYGARRGPSGFRGTEAKRGGLGYKKGLRGVTWGRYNETAKRIEQIDRTCVTVD